MTDLQEKTAVEIFKDVITNDPVLRKTYEAVNSVFRNEDNLRAYLRYEKAASDEVTRINGARREGRQERDQEIARNLNGHTHRADSPITFMALKNSRLSFSVFI